MSNIVAAGTHFCLLLVNYDDERRDHVIILKFGNQKKRATQELENVLVRRIQSLDTEIDELANRFMHMSIQDGQAGSVVIYVKALTDSAAENVNKHHLKAFIQKVLQDPEVNRLLPVGTFNIQVETITSGFVQGSFLVQFFRRFELTIHDFFIYHLFFPLQKRYGR